MKLRNLFFAAAAMAGVFSACSNEMDEAANGGEQFNAEAFASVSFSMPAAGGMTRAAGEETGTSSEGNIKEVYFLLYNTAGELAQAPEKRVLADFGKSAETTTGGKVIYTLKKDKNIAIKAVGTYNVHVIVNPATAIQAAVEGPLKKIADFNAYVEKVAAKTGNYCRTNEFMMTNAENAVSAVIVATNNSNNPAVIQIPVERLAAKYAIDITNAAIDIATGGKITFDAYKIVNTRNSAYGVRRVGTTQADAVIGAPEAADKYVIENLFDTKSSAWADAVWNTNYSRKMSATSYVSFRKLDYTNGQTLAYALENTIKANDKVAKGYTTGVILRGKVTGLTLKGTKPEKFDGTFYKFRGNFYYTLSDIEKEYPAETDLMMYSTNKQGEETKAEYLTRISNDKVFLYNSISIELFAKGYCYYTYFLRHNDNNVAETVGVMEYATVRNNVYKMSVKSVSGLGSFESGTAGPVDPAKPTEGQDDIDTKTDGTEIPNPEIPSVIAPDQETSIPAIPVEPGTPVVDTDMYLNVILSVNPWTVRNNEMDL